MNQTAALEANIIEVCAKHKSEHWTERGYRAAVRVGTDYLVKFGDPADLVPEIETQKYIFSYAMSNPGNSVPRIPRVVHAFIHGRTMYLVMEFIKLLPTPPDIMAQVAPALMWLTTVPAPPNVLGPLGGGYIRHKFFKEAKAPLCFSSVEALERYMNKAYTLLSLRSRQITSSVEIRNDRLIFSQSDMDASNFGVDENGKTVLMDFVEIGVLPETFVAHTLYSKQGFAPVATALGLSDKSISSMSVISSVVWMAANPKLGLDEDGNPKARGK